MAYPMRYARTRRYKLIHNLNYWAPFPIDQDFYLSPTFQDLLQRTYHNQSLHWYKPSLRVYYQRPEYELYDLKIDPEEKHNVAEKPNYQGKLTKLQNRLLKWQEKTRDPWICSPHSVLENKGHFKDNAQCLPLFN